MSIYHQLCARWSADLVFLFIVLIDWALSGRAFNVSVAVLPRCWGALGFLGGMGRALLQQGSCCWMIYTAGVLSGWACTQLCQFENVMKRQLEADHKRNIFCALTVFTVSNKPSFFFWYLCLTTLVLSSWFLLLLWLIVSSKYIFEVFWWWKVCFGKSRWLPF